MNDSTQTPQHLFSFSNFGGLETSFILIILLIALFEIWMIVDVIRNRKVPTNHKIWWLVGMFLIHPIVAMVYYVVTRWTDTYKK